MSSASVNRDLASDYVASVVEKYAVHVGPGSAAVRAANELVPALREWAGRYLLDIGVSGSYAKGTAISLGTDVDVFVSLSEVAGDSMKHIYWSLFQFLADRGLRPQAWNVSVRVERTGIQVDVVPGRKQQGSAGDHTLYRRKKGSWVQTNVAEHIRLVLGSGRTREIRALKIWRERNRLDFPSFYLELVVMKALSGARAEGLAGNVSRVFEFLSDRFERARVVDPANSKNVLSDDLSPEEKRVIAVAAGKSLMRIGARLPQGLKPTLLPAFAARLKPCPPENPGRLPNPMLPESSGWEGVLW